jgi:hypothetical protein
MIKGVQTRVDSEIHPVALIENAEAIQAAIMHMIDAVLKRHHRQQARQHRSESPPHRGKNSRNVYFHIRPDDMIREVPNYAEQYLTEHPELNPPEPAQANPLSPHLRTQRRLPRNRATAQTVWRPHRNRTTGHTGWRPQPLSQPRSGARRGNKSRNPAPEERQKSCDLHVRPERSPIAEKSFQPSPKQKAGTDATPLLTNCQTELNQELKKLEASIEGAMRGDWGDLRTVFNGIGLTPRKPQSSKNPHPTENQETIHKSSCRRERPRSCSFSQPQPGWKNSISRMLGEGHDFSSAV